MTTPTVDDLIKLSQKPAAKTPSVKPRGFADRFVDSVKEATQYGFPGKMARMINDFRDAGSAEIRKRNPKWTEKQVEDASDQLIADTQRKLREEFKAKHDADPNWRPDESFVEATLSGRWLPWIAGQAVGGAGPDMLIGGGAAPLARIGIQGLAGAGTDIASQVADIADTVQDKYDPAQTALSAIGNAGFAGVLEGAAKGLGKLRPKAEEVSVEDAASRALGNASFSPKPLTPEQPGQKRLIELEREAAELGDTHPAAPAIRAEINELRDAGVTHPADAPINLTPEEQAAAALGDASFTAKPLDSSADPSVAVSVHKPGDDVVTRLTSALKNAGAARREQKVAVSKYRSEQAKRLKAIQSSTDGRAGLQLELAALRGEQPKADFESVEDQFSQQDVTNLFRMVKSTKGLSPFDQLNARVALSKLLQGEAPTPSQLDLLAKTFPPKFVKEALKRRARGEKVADFLGNAVNLPRALMSSFDLSAPFRQGIFLVGRKEFWKSFPEMFKQFAKGMKDDTAFESFMAEIKSRPTAELMDEAGLSFTGVGKALTDREEAFMSSWAQKIPGIGRFVAGAERGYSAFLNKLRADVFDDLVRLQAQAGTDFVENPKALKDMAKFINAATGRGSLGPVAQAGPLLNGLFFSPRLIASRVELLRPSTYIGLDPVVRREAVKSLLSFGALATTVGGLAAMGGLPVETDPRSSDFMKIRVKNTRYDILGGFGQYITLGARLVDNARMTSKGEIKTLGETPLVGSGYDTLLDFTRNKFSPVASFVADMLDRKNAIGQPFDPTDPNPLDNSVTQRFIPLFIQDVFKLLEENNGDILPTIAMAAPGFFGVGMQTYDETAPRTASQLVKGADVIEEAEPAPSDEPSLEDLLASGQLIEE